MATNIIRKLRDMFLVKPDGSRHNMAPGKHYVMTRQGTVEEVPDDDVDRVHDAYADNHNTLLALGSKGDLRQLETIIRNISSIHANAVMPSDIFYRLAPDAPRSGEVGQNVVVDLGVQHELRGLVVNNPLYPTSINVFVYGSNDNSTWTRVAALIVSRSDTSPAISQHPFTTEPYRYYKWNTNNSQPPQAAFMIGDKFVPKYLSTAESNRISELVAEPYYLSMFVDGGVPSGEDLLRFVMPQRLYWRGGMDGKFGHVDTPPSAQFSMKVFKNGVHFDTFGINTNGDFSLTSGTRWFEKGDVLLIKAQDTGDTSITGLALTITLERDV